MRRRALSAALALVPLLALAQPWAPPVESDLKFDDLFPRRSFFGKTASGMDWSRDDRYLKYLWNPYETRASDLWIHDTKSGKTGRATSIELMAHFDPEARRAIERYRKDDRERDERLKLGEKEYREAEIKLRKENEERKEPLPSYPGIGEFSWANEKPEALFVYRGDLYHLALDPAKLAEQKAVLPPKADEIVREVEGPAGTITRLTRTRDAETDVRWMPGDEGFYFRRGEGLYRMRFDSPVVEQLDPKLPNNLPLWGYSLSPDGNRMMIFTGRSTGQYNQIAWITYRGRFPEIRRTNQYWGTPDEKIQEERFLYLYDLTKPDSEDNKPWEVWSWKSADEDDVVKEVVTHSEPWSADSGRFVFAAINRRTREREIVVADLATKKLDALHKTVEPGEMLTGEFAAPRFTPDGKQVLALLETTGWRLPWLIDPVTKSVRAVVQGAYEAYPMRFSPDGKTLVVWSTRLHPARQQIDRIDVATGKIERWSTGDGRYQTPTVSWNAERAAAVFGSWTSPNELALIDGRRQTTLTASHRTEEFMAVNRLQPQLFEFQNRHGQTVYGYVFLPPDWKKGDVRPAMVYTYGGPLRISNSVDDGSFNTTGYLLNMWLAYALGYVTATIDPRGASGYGAQFGRASFGSVGVPQTEDLVDAARYLQREYGADPTRMGLNGWSFGGWQTQHTMYTEPGVYTLGIAGAGPTEWQNYNQGYTQEVIAVQPAGKIDELDKFSLTKVAMNLRDPLLLIHGMEDDNVLFQHSIAVYRVLLQHGLGPLVEFLVDPTGGHGLGGDINRRDSQAHYVRFLLKHWGSQRADGAKSGG